MRSLDPDRPCLTDLPARRAIRALDARSVLLLTCQDVLPLDADARGSAAIGLDGFLGGLRVTTSCSYRIATGKPASRFRNHSPTQVLWSGHKLITRTLTTTVQASQCDANRALLPPRAARVLLLPRFCAGGSSWGVRDFATPPSSVWHFGLPYVRERERVWWCESQPRMHACLGGNPRISCGLASLCVCLSLTIYFLCVLKCRADFSPLSHEAEVAPLYLLPPSKSSGIHTLCHIGIAHNRTGAGFFLGILARGTGREWSRGPSRMTFGRRHQKGVDHFRSVVSGYAAQPRRCRSRSQMLASRVPKKDIMNENTATSTTGGCQATPPG